MGSIRSVSRPYVPWIVASGILAGNVAIVCWFQAEYRNVLRIPEYLQIGATLLSSLLLFDTLMAVCWYAHLTRRLSESSHAQYSLAFADHQQSNKPIVFTERAENPQDGRFHYQIHNVGHGVAINVWYIDETGGERRLRSLGALGAGATRVLIGEVEGHFRNNPGQFRHLLAAEGIITRTAQWTVTINVRGEAAGSDMQHRLARFEPVRKERSVDKLLEDEWRNFKVQLDEVKLLPK